MKEPRDDLQLDEGVVDDVSKFCYLGDILDSEGGVEPAVRVTVSALRVTSGEISLMYR